jgi:hypothetical protein
MWEQDLKDKTTKQFTSMLGKPTEKQSLDCFDG